MGTTQLTIVLILDVAITVAICRYAGWREVRDLGSWVLAGVVALPFAFLPAAPFFASSARQPPMPGTGVPRTVFAASPACPIASPASTSGPTPRQLRVVPGWVQGVVDHSQIVGSNVRFCGWAANLGHHQIADSVLVYANGRFAGAVKPTISRPDVVKARGPLGEKSGFGVRLPLSVVRRRGHTAKVQLFGLERGVASPLPYGCVGKPQDFGCGR